MKRTPCPIRHKLLRIKGVNEDKATQMSLYYTRTSNAYSGVLSESLNGRKNAPSKLSENIVETKFLLKRSYDHSYIDRLPLLPKNSLSVKGRYSAFLEKKAIHGNKTTKHSMNYYNKHAKINLKTDYFGTRSNIQIRSTCDNTYIKKRIRNTNNLYDTIIYLRSIRKFRKEFKVSDKQIIDLINQYKTLLLIQKKHRTNSFASLLTKDCTLILYSA